MQKNTRNNAPLVLMLAYFKVSESREVEPRYLGVSNIQTTFGHRTSPETFKNHPLAFVF